MAHDCIFCNIIAGQAPSVQVYDDDRVTAFADIFPLEPGHLLVVPKQHVRDIYELEEELGAHLFRVAVRMAKIMKQELRPDGMNLFQANEVVGGQEVFHFHLHVLPRYEGRWPFQIDMSKRRHHTAQELEQVFQDVRRSVAQ